MRWPAPHTLLARLLLAYLVSTLVLFAVFGYLVYRITERSLEDSLGRRLTGLAQATATQVMPETVLFLSPGDEASRTAQRLRHKLQQLQERTQVARVFVLDKRLRSKIDTQGEMRIGDLHYHAEADRSELRKVFAGQAASSVLFRGPEGQIYKTGYAPIQRDQEVVAALGVVGSARFYLGLAQLRNYLVLSGAIVALLVSLISLFLARRITSPLRQLAREAARIGAGRLEQPIAVHSKDEVGLLSRTMNEMREDLYRRDQQMQLMLSGIAHEVRNPLGGIELFSGLLREDLQGEPERLENVQRIERELTHLKQVVGDFLDYARRAAPRLAPVELAGLSAEVIELLRGDAAARAVELVLAPGQDPGRCPCDQTQIRRVLINLVRNALQASAAGGQVTLRCGALAGRAYCEVEDQGVGIAPELQEQIFTPFFTTREKGTGLGLALAKKIIDEHQGELLVQSAPGAGSRFRLTLPQRKADGDDSDHR